MKTSVTFTVAVLFAAVAGAYFYYVPQESKPAPSEAPLKVMPADDKSPVTWLQIQVLETNETLTLDKKEGSWKIRFPVAYPADNLMVDGLVTALRVSGRARRLLPEKDWDEYGLLRPSIKVGVETQNGQRRYLYLGDPSPVGPFVYARWEGDKEYFLVDANLKKAFTRSTYSLRLKQVFRTPLNEVTRMRIRTLGSEYEVEKKGENWYWLEPIELLGKKISKQYVDQLVSQYADLYVKEFLDDEKTPESDLGFSLTSPWIRLWGKDPKTAIEEIRIGEEQPPRDSFIAYHGSDKLYFLIARTNVRKLFQIFETMAQEFREQDAPAAPAAPPAPAPAQNSGALEELRK